MERLFALWFSGQTSFEFARDPKANEVTDLAEVSRDRWCTDASWNCARIMGKPEFRAKRALPIGKHGQLQGWRVSCINTLSGKTIILNNR